VYYSRYVPGLRSSNQIVKDFAKHISLPETEASPRVTIFAKSFFLALREDLLHREPHKKLSGKIFLAESHYFFAESH
jgi:hypothetical protein